MQVVVGTQLNAEDEARLRSTFSDITFHFVENAEVGQAVGACEVLFAHISNTVLENAPHLKWVQLRSAGVNNMPFAELKRRSILLTNASGAHGVPIAENFLSLMLAFSNRLPTLLDAQCRHEWVASKVRDDRNFQPEKGHRFEIEGQTLLVVGLGDLGATLARKAAALDMRVIGIRSRALPPPPGVSAVFTHDRLHDALAQADHVALCLPLTPETTDYLGEPELRAMKKTAYLYNAGRGKSIAKEPLLRALHEGWIAGAGLDVTDPEPLPPDDPLWDAPNTILTQHTSGGSPLNSRRCTDIFLDNLRRYQAGEPLHNLVDLDRQY